MTDTLSDCTMGVGDGNGKLFVHGDYESIKAAQAIVLERDELRKKLAQSEIPVVHLNEEDLAHRVSTALSKHIDISNVDCEFGVNELDDLTVTICKAIEPHQNAIYDNGYRSGMLQEQAIAATKRESGCQKCGGRLDGDEYGGCTKGHCFFDAGLEAWAIYLPAAKAFAQIFDTEDDAKYQCPSTGIVIHLRQSDTPTKRYHAKYCKAHNDYRVYVVGDDNNPVQIRNTMKEATDDARQLNSIEVQEGK